MFLDSGTKQEDLLPAEHANSMHTKQRRAATVTNCATIQRGLDDVRC